MKRIGQRITGAWVSLGPRFLPFADVATADVPLSRLLRLSLFQISVGMATVMLVGTLNRVMIVELGVSASLVAIMVALPLVFAPFRALIGYRSDTHRCELGWRRVPFIWKGTLLQFGGFAIMPFALLVLAGKGQAAEAPAWLGHVAAALAFLLVGAGLHMVQTVGLALATDLVPQESHPRVVGLMYVMLLAGMIGSALLFGALLADFTPGRLVQVIQGAAVATMALNLVALWKQEVRRPRRGAAAPAPDPSFTESWARFSSGERTRLRLAAVGLGTMAFAMADIVLEPYGGQVLGMSVGMTTKLTALLAFGGLIGFVLASHVLGRGADPFRIAQLGALIGLPGFVAVIAAAPAGWVPLFLAGNFMIGFGAALFGHGTLTATMNLAPREQAGLALGAWGAVQATGAGLGMVLSGVLRDGIHAVAGGGAGPWGLDGAAYGYLGVYVVELTLLAITAAVIVPLLRGGPRPSMGTDDVGVDARLGTRAGNTA
jgi:BCD family chlorophyll transporter-like MFS transporter